MQSQTFIDTLNKLENNELDNFLFSQCQELSLCLKLAMTETTDEAILTELSKDKNKKIRREIAKNQYSPKELLVALCTDKNEFIQEYAFKNPNFSIKALEDMAKSDDEDLRSKVAFNPNTPLYLLKQLSQDKSTDVRHAAVAHIKIPFHIMDKFYYEERVEYCNHMGLDPEIEAGSFENWHESYKLSEYMSSIPPNLETPPELLVKHIISLDSKSNRIEIIYDYREIASHPNLPPEALKLLADNKNIEVRNLAAIHPNTSYDTLLSMVTSKSAKVRAKVTENPNLKEDELHKLSKDKNELVVKKAIVALLIYSSEALKDLELNPEYLLENGYEFESLKGIAKPKKLAQALIGTSHSEEMKLLYCNKNWDGLGALSTLQAIFINPIKQKLDRHSYLEFLSDINSVGDFSWLSKILPEQLKFFIKLFGNNSLKALEHSYVNNEEKEDVLRMLHGCVVKEYESDQLKQEKLVVNWVNKNKTFGMRFHDYLMKKDWRDNKTDSSDDNFFPQSQFKDKIKELDDQNWSTFLPTNHSELKKIAHSQRHCVGGKFYAEQVMRGVNYIFSINPIVKGQEKLNKGYTFQYSHDGELLQARGYCNCEVPDELIERSKKIFKLLEYSE